MGQGESGAGREWARAEGAPFVLPSGPKCSLCWVCYPQTAILRALASGSPLYSHK